MIMMDVRVAQVSYWSRSRVESFCYRNARSLTTTGKPQALDGAGCTTLTADVSFQRVLNGAGCTTLTAGPKWLRASHPRDTWRGSCFRRPQTSQGSHRAGAGLARFISHLSASSNRRTRRMVPFSVFVCVKARKSTVYIQSSISISTPLAPAWYALSSSPLV